MRKLFGPQYTISNRFWVENVKSEANFYPGPDLEVTFTPRGRGWGSKALSGAVTVRAGIVVVVQCNGHRPSSEFVTQRTPYHGRAIPALEGDIRREED